MKRSLTGLMYAVVFSMALVLGSTAAFATNGMNLEGYGPIATGMGGASMAYDNGTAAMMNNPATLGLMSPGNRLDLAFGYLGPHITASAPGESDAESSSRAFYMPAIGWAQKNGKMTYGVGMFAQGGMGAEYDKGSFLAYGSPENVRSELSVGRVLVPFVYEVNKQFIVAASLDFVWAGLDLKMALDGLQFFNLAGMDPRPGAIQNQYGTASGSMLTAFSTIMPALDPAGPVNWARFDFSDSSDFTGEASATGFAGKVGGVFKVNDKVSLGLAYHSKTWLGDLETSNAKVSFNANVDSGIMSTGIPNGIFVPATIPLTGKIQVKDFQWPQTIGAGIAYQATDKLMIVFDYKWINWADVMKSFKMTFTVDAGQPGMAGAFDNTVLNASLIQNWEDQNVFMIGAGYKVSPEWTLRAGLNYANNPIPDTYMNALFPAIEKSHITLGAGYMISKASSVDFSFTYAPEVKATSGPEAPEGATVKHYQTNSQIMYSYRF